MEIWQEVIIVVIAVILVLGAAATVAFPYIRDAVLKKSEKKEKTEEVHHLPGAEPEKAEEPQTSEPEEPREAPETVEHTQREKERIEASKTQEQKEAETQNAIAVLFGGKENVTSIEARGSRVTISVKDTSLIHSEDFEKAGIKGAVIMSDRIMFVVGNNAEEFAENLKKEIGLE